jgi:hypothetical protein
MESISIEEEDDIDATEVDEDEEDVPIISRRKRVSGLVQLTGKPKTPRKSTPKKSRAKKGKSDEVKIVPASDDDATPKPSTPRKPRGRAKKAKAVDDIVDPKIQSHLQKQTTNSSIIPDSAGEAKDVWIISSDDE